MPTDDLLTRRKETIGVRVPKGFVLRERDATAGALIEL
jgi:hypothetical protein